MSFIRPELRNPIIGVTRSAKGIPKIMAGPV
jgi:hypothetical protein